MIINANWIGKMTKETNQEQQNQETPKYGDIRNLHTEFLMSRYAILLASYLGWCR